MASAKALTEFRISRWLVSGSACGSTCDERGRPRRLSKRNGSIGRQSTSPHPSIASLGVEKRHRGLAPRRFEKRRRNGIETAALLQHVFWGTHQADGLGAALRDVLVLELLGEGQRVCLAVGPAGLQGVGFIGLRSQRRRFVGERKAEHRTAQAAPWNCDAKGREKENRCTHRRQDDAQAAAGDVPVENAVSGADR